MGTKEILEFWWVAVGLLAFPLAWIGGYLSSIRNESWKRHTGYALCVLALLSLVTANVFSPETPVGFEEIVFIVWIAMYTALVAVFLTGWDDRRIKSLFQDPILSP